MLFVVLQCRRGHDRCPSSHNDLFVSPRAFSNTLTSPTQEVIEHRLLTRPTFVCEVVFQSEVVEGDFAFLCYGHVCSKPFWWRSVNVQALSVLFSSQAVTPPNFIGTDVRNSLGKFFNLTHVINDVDAFSVYPCSSSDAGCMSPGIRRGRVLTERCHQRRTHCVLFTVTRGEQNSEVHQVKPWFQHRGGDFLSASLTVAHTRLEVIGVLEENQSSLKIPNRTTSQSFFDAAPSAVFAVAFDGVHVEEDPEHRQPHGAQDGSGLPFRVGGLHDRLRR